MNIIESAKFVKGLPPAADRWNTSPATDIVNAKLYGKIAFLVHQEGGTTGKATLTVEACSDVSGTGATAIPFAYSVGGSGAGAAGDDTGLIVQAAAAGFDTTPAVDKLYVIDVDASGLPADKPFLRLKCTESVNDPVNGSVEIILYQARYAGAALPSAIA